MAEKEKTETLGGGAPDSLVTKVLREQPSAPECAEGPSFWAENTRVPALWPCRWGSRAPHMSLIMCRDPTLRKAQTPLRADKLPGCRSST